VGENEETMINHIGPTPEEKICIAWMKDVERYERLLAKADDKLVIYVWVALGLGFVVGLLF
jgi:hypothetical protein